MARLYANENFPFLVVTELRRLSHDVVTIQETGYANQRTADAAVLSYATLDNRAVLTLNRKHFIRLHHEQPTHAGIIVCKVDANFLQQAAALMPSGLFDGGCQAGHSRFGRVDGQVLVVRATHKADQANGRDQTQNDTRNKFHATDLGVKRGILPSLVEISVPWDAPLQRQ